MSPSRPGVRVTTAAESAARDAAAIAAGTPSADLMQRAGEAAARVIRERYPRRLARGAVAFAGAGNNGGDAYVVAAALSEAGARVAVVEVEPPRTPDAIAARERWMARNAESPPARASRTSLDSDALVIDGILGTGASGAPRAAAADAIRRVLALRAAGARVVALDLPSGVDATTGAVAVDGGAVVSDLTLTFGTAKRGLLLARDHAGAIAVLDIGLGVHATLDDHAPALVDAAFVHAALPRIAAASHKGTRGRIAVLGGCEGMAGAAILAARGAHAASAGLVRLVVAPASIAAVQAAEPQATASAWPGSDDEARDLLDGLAHALLIGPGLGRTRHALALVERALRVWRGPVVLDADGLSLFEDDPDALGALLAGRPSLLTPHAGELARLTGATASDVVANAFDAGGEVAVRTGAVVLLKGVPTVITAPDGRRLVSAAGSPVLGAGGSGDILGGIAATLLAQTNGEPLPSAACAAWVHGSAGERAASHHGVRGTTLDHVLHALAGAWPRSPRAPRPPVLAKLPRAGDRP